MAQSGKTHILVVDDDDTIGKILELVLEEQGFQVLVAHSGEEGLKLASAHAPDMAILDVMLPGMDGYTLCRKLRAMPTTRLLPILMLTAQSETRDKLTGFDAGADDYVTKPFDPQELVLRVKALMARSQMPQAATGKPAERGQVVAVFGAKGGVGKTTLAVNVAVALAKLKNLRVALVDADFSFGDVGTHLNVAPSRTILDLATRIDDLDEEVLRKVLVRHESGVNLLMAPYHPEDAERISPEVMMRIIERLVMVHDVVMLDCAAAYDERTLTVLERADQILMILTPEMGPIKNTSTFLGLTQKMEMPATKISLVLNRANSEGAIPAAEIERALQKPIPAQVASGGRAVVLSVNQGLPLVLTEPQHPFSLQVVRLAELVRTLTRVGVK